MNLFGPPPAAPPPLPKAVWPRDGQGVVIQCAVAFSVLGRLILASAEGSRGVCFLGLGEEDLELLAAVQRQYPRAQLAAGGETLQDYSSAICAALADGRPCEAVPVDVSGTEFQRSVWAFLQSIPFGQTRTYHWIAAAMGNPGAVRAVGAACAANPVSILIPCHRAIGAYGSLHGFRWGLDRKRALLTLESTTQGQTS